MAQYMILAKYKSEVLKAMIENPDLLIERERHMDSFYGTAGAKVEKAYFIRDAEHNFIVIVDFPDEQAAHAALLVGLSSGSFENAVMRRLTSLEQAVDDFRRAGNTARGFYAPGTMKGDNK